MRKRPSQTRRLPNGSLAGQTRSQQQSDLHDAADGDDEELETGLTLLGVVALEDPLRPAAPGAVHAARRAGIGVRMLTGDHRATALAIAQKLGIENNDVFSRATPAGKLEMVDSLQDAGEVVAVTGDGVNDSPRASPRRRRCRNGSSGRGGCP
jgi:magnesium-transporting ATPase (P-type)